MSNPANPDRRSGTRSTARRQVLRATAVGLGVAVAGCAGGGGTDGGAGDGGGGEEPTGDSGTDNPGGNTGAPDTWPMRGRTPGRTYATPAEVPTTLDSLEKLRGDRAPLVTDAGVLTYDVTDPLTLTDPKSGETVYETEYQPGGEVFVHDSTVFLYSDGGVVGLSLENGERAWREETGSTTLFPAGDAFGYWGKTETDGGEVQPELVVVDAQSRQRRWSQRLSDSNRHFGEPVVDVGSGTLFVADAPDKSFSNAARYLTAYDLQSGEQRWRIEGRYDPKTVRGGRLLATHRRPDAGSPQLVALGAAGGDRKWSREGRKFALTQPAFGEDSVYVAADSTVHAIGPDGEDRWSYRVQGSPVVPSLAAAANGVVVGAGSRVLVVEAEGSVAGEYDLGDDGGYRAQKVVPTSDRIWALDTKLGLVSVSGS